nr:hypothetical protein [Dechloromonas sp.]
MRRAIAALPAAVTACCILALLVHGPLPQPADYHAFADTADFLRIGRGRDVLSNLGFALAGLWGMARLWPQRRHPAIASGFTGYTLLLLGLVLTAAGSAYYHLAPDNDRLLLDRLPIALACAGLLAGVWAETGLPRPYALPLAGGLAAYAVASVFWWYGTERAGAGDLRPYILLQILPILLIPLRQAIYGSPAADRLSFGLALGLYVLAKLAEIYDAPLLGLSAGLLSGHSLKHLLATAAAALIVGRLVHRTRSPA